MGIVGPACKVDAVAVKGSLLKITNPASGGAGSARAASESQLFSPDFSLQDLGIGGLDKQVGECTRPEATSVLDLELLVYGALGY